MAYLRSHFGNWGSGEMQESNFKITGIERLVVRPGFSGRFHHVTFKCGSRRSSPSSLQVWVPVAHPEAEVEEVARTFLRHRLRELAELVKASASEEAAIGALPKVGRDNWSVRAAQRECRSSQILRHLERAHIQLARYTLDRRHQPVPCGDLVLWKAWMNTSERWVDDTLLSDPDNSPVRACTVFLGLDVAFGGAARPVLFETLVLGGMCDRELYRYCTWQEAEDGHAAIVNHLQAQTVKAPALVAAWNLAQRTVKASGQPVMKAFVEQCANLSVP